MRLILLGYLIGYFFGSTLVYLAGGPFPDPAVILVSFISFALTLLIGDAILQSVRPR